MAYFYDSKPTFLWIKVSLNKAKIRYSQKLFSLTVPPYNAPMPGGNKRSYILNIRCTPCATWTESNIPLIKTKHNFFKNSLFPSVIIEWDNLDPNLGNSKRISVFKKKVLNFIRPSPNSVFDIHNRKGIKLITRHRLGLSHLRKHKFKHSFQDTINPLCICG